MGTTFITEYQQEMREVLAAARLARTPILLSSDPGWGKTSFLRKYADDNGEHIEAITASNREPTDFLGLPFRQDYDGVLVAENALPAWFQRLMKAGKGLLFVDELSIAPYAVQGAILTIMQDRCIGEHRLSDDVLIVAAANPITSAAGGWPFAAPLANRLCHLDWRPPIEDVLLGITENWGHEDTAIPELLFRARVATFLKSHSDLVHAMPDDQDKAAGAWPSPRSWDNGARACAYLERNRPVMERVLSGFVGTSASTSFIRWSIELQLPDPFKVLDGDHPDWNDPGLRTDAAYATLSSILSITAQSPDKYYDKAVDVFVGMADTRTADAAGALVKRLVGIHPGAGTSAAPPKEILKLVKAFNKLFAGAGRARRLSDDS